MKTARRGRPIKSVTGTKRVQLNILIRADLRRMIERAAKRNDRTLSAEAELWLERLITYESFAKAFANFQPDKSLGVRFRDAFAGLLADKDSDEQRRAFAKVLTPGEPEDEDGEGSKS